jgi:hypothetical protein
VEGRCNTQQFLKMQLFRAASTPELRKVVAQRNPNTMTLDDMYQIATDTQRKPVPKSNKRLQPSSQKTTMTKLRLFRGKRTKTATDGKPHPRTQRPKLDRRGTPATTRATQGLETMPTGMENNASTANYRTIPRMNVSKKFLKRNRAETDKAGPIGLECI